MTFEHAKDEVIARANVVDVESYEEAQATEPRILNLYLDVDGMYRWYEQDNATPADGDRIHSAVAAGRLQWPGFDVVEVRGRAVSAPDDIQDSFAADELEETGKQST